MTAVDPTPSVAPHASGATAHEHVSDARLRDVVAAYVGLTKPRIIELLLLTTVPVMFLAERGVPDVAAIVAFEHHANVDGTGYPRLGRGARPHLASQIVHVADVFDALRTNRPYRTAMDAVTVRGVLLEGAGKAFDPALVDLFLERVVKLPTSHAGPVGERR